MLEKNALNVLQDTRRRNLGAQTSEASQDDGGESDLEANGGLASSSPKVAGETTGSATNSPKDVHFFGDFTGGSKHMVSPAHISRGDGEDANYGAELSSPKAVAVNELSSPC